MTWLPSLAGELAITMSDRSVWLAIGLALLCGGGCLVFGAAVARTVGLLRADAPAGETLGVGLASGLLVLAAWWAAIWSGGRSSFTPVAVGFAIALALALVRRGRRHPTGGASAADEIATTGALTTSRAPRRRPRLFTGLIAALFIVAVSLVYGATMAPSPRNGVQPVEAMDDAFYAVLGADLATTGTETNTTPSGFAEIPGLPAQTWYHWGELWLAAAVISLTGTAPLLARYLVVLPVLLLAAAALTGTLVRRMSGTSSRGAYLFGVLVCLFLAPIPLLPGPFFGAWAAGLIFGINLFGLAAVAALLALYGLAVLGTRTPTWALAAFAGSAAACILPAHIVIALLGLVGVGFVWAIRIGESLQTTRRLPVVSPIWRRTLIVAGIVLLATVAWGELTGHGLGGGGVPPTVSPFNATWAASIAITALGAGVFFAIPVAWFLARKDAPIQADLYLGTLVLLLAGAIAWGARLGDFNMFYVFFGGIAVFAMPAAAVAVWRLWEQLRATGHRRLAVGLAVLCLVQLELGSTLGLIRLERTGPHDYQPIPVSLLDAIKNLPADAELAYACRPFEEVAFANPKLVSIDAHTGRPVVPMCFEADVPSTLVGATPSAQAPNPGFAWAPQHPLYPNASAHPSSAAVSSFLKTHGIDYIFADAMHPNTLVSDAVPIARSGDAEVLRVP